MDTDSKYHKLTYLLILILALFAHLTGLLNDVFLSDAALYASIAKEMAIWKPGKQRGKPVSVKYLLPVEFK